MDFSAEFSRFTTGPDGAPWERKDQLVLGAAWFVRPSAKLFAEYIRVDGCTPLDFISGGSVKDEIGKVIPDQTHSDGSARSDVNLVGVNVVFRHVGTRFRFPQRIRESIHKPRRDRYAGDFAPSRKQPEKLRFGTWPAMAA